MSRTKCARCDWRRPHQPADDEPATLEAHEAASGHPTCQLCGHSLTREEAVTCTACIAVAHRKLEEIVTGCKQLHEQLGWPSTQVYNRNGRSNDVTLPGGAVLALVSPGSAGAGARHLTRAERDAGVDGREHAADNKPDDPPSVAYILGAWEDEWRTNRHDPAAVHLPTVTTAAAYLMRHTTWAARETQTFGEYVDALRQLAAHVRRATGADDRPLRADVRCFDCEAPLERANHEPTECQRQHVGGDCTYNWAGERVCGPYGPHNHPAPCDCDRGGISDQWRCSRCRRPYRWKEYMLAVRAAVEDAGGRPPHERAVPAKRSETEPEGLVIHDHRTGTTLNDAPHHLDTA